MEVGLDYGYLSEGAPSRPATEQRITKLEEQQLDGTLVAEAISKTNASKNLLTHALKRIAKLETCLFAMYQKLVQLQTQKQSAELSGQP